MKTFSIKFNSKKSLGFQGLEKPKFVPGVNTIPESEWDAIKENVYVSRLFLDGNLEWVGGVSPYDGIEQGENAIPAVMSQNMAVAAIKATTKKEVLEKWLGIENRDKVIASIKEQIEKLNITPEKKSSKSEKTDK